MIGFLVWCAVCVIIALVMASLGCRVGLHRWDPCLGYCTDCGKNDEFIRPGHADEDVGKNRP